MFEPMVERVDGEVDGCDGRYDDAINVWTEGELCRRIVNLIIRLMNGQLGGTAC